jgi:cardiolipin synthase
MVRSQARRCPAWPDWAVALVVLFVLFAWVGGCASPPDPVAEELQSAGVLDHPPKGAYYRAGELVLEYELNGEPVFLTAHWPAGHADGSGHQFRMAVLGAASDAPSTPAVLRSEWQPVTLLGSTRWDALVESVLEHFAPEDPAATTLVTVQGEEFVLQRDGSGVLHSYRFDTLPGGLPIGQRISEDAFSARANELLKAQLPGEDDGAVPVLFALGGDEFGGSFVLFDFAREESVFIAHAPAPSPSGEDLEFSLRLVDAVAVRSHLFSIVRHPFTMANRLFWLTTHTGAAMLPYGVSAGGEAPPPVAEREFMDPVAWEERLDQLVGEARYRGEMKLLIDGEAFFTSLTEAIYEAEHSIDIRLYIFDRDDYALRIADLLKERSREIRVRVMIDRIGTLVAGHANAGSPYHTRSETQSSIIDYLQRDSEVKVRVVDNPWLTSDHTKVIIVDRRKAYVGGMNIGYQYRYEWHDLMVEVSGPIVGRLFKDFRKRWAHAGLGGDLAFAVAAARGESFVGDAEAPEFMEIRPLYTRTGDAQILRAQLAAIRRARSRIYIQQPYVSDDAVIAALIQARQRGVDVRFILPASSDSGFMNSANLITATAFLNNGIRVYIYPGMTHVKAAIYDGWAIVGSANFDKLSLRINQETNLATSDPRFVEQLASELFEVDFARSKEWTETRRIGWNDYIANFIANHL